MRIRPATAADAEAGSAVLRRSIVELCHADHGGSERAIAAWTANKTPEAWLAWLDRPDCSLLVAEDGCLLGVAMADGDGRILLNYVSPDARFAGVSTALLDALEAWARAAGLAECVLDSTRTAERFYRARGYEPVGADDLTMRKRLVPAGRSALAAPDAPR